MPSHTPAERLKKKRAQEIRDDPLFLQKRVAAEIEQEQPRQEQLKAELAAENLTLQQETAERAAPTQQDIDEDVKLGLTIQNMRRQALLNVLGIPREEQAPSAPAVITAERGEQAIIPAPRPAGAAALTPTPIAETAPRFGVSPTFAGGERFNVPQKIPFSQIKSGTPAEILTETAEITANVIDTITDLIPLDILSFSTKQQPDVTTAQESLTNAIQEMNRRIELVRLGILDATQTQQDFLRIGGAIQQLESSQKGFGKLNLRYWLGGGREIEQEIIIAKQRYNDFIRELELAAIEGRAAQQQAQIRAAAAAFGVEQ